TCMDSQIAAAFSRPERSVVFTIERAGLDEPLTFTLNPQHDNISGLRSIGVTPARSTTIFKKVEDNVLEDTLKTLELENSGIKAAMRLLSVEGREISTFQQFQQIAKESDGRPLSTIWTAVDETDAPVGSTFSVNIPLSPEYQVQPYPEPVDEKFPNYEVGLIGISPLTRIIRVIKGTQNEGILQVGDVVLRIGDVDGPRQTQLREELTHHSGSTVDMEVLRDGERLTLTAKVNRKSQLGVNIAYAYDVPLIAETFDRIALPSTPNKPRDVVPTPVADLRLLPLTRIESLDDMPITDWRSLWVALRERTRNAFEMKQGASLRLTVTPPTSNQDPETLELALSADDVRALHDLTWISKLPDYLFEPILITRSAEGDPFKALTMGVQETKKLIIMTYLTIDRLFRRTIGVEQLRGPVGIIHIGVRIADRGFIYMLFFLGMISVNLAVINFLPLPIVDGGLFLFLIYEKLKGRPPSIAFQNATTILGLFFIGTIFLVTFYNDVMRLFP
ncbi:MAG: site-2 protease family protein, partial [Planctomycetes bacterium]|nr:site-2 protease family protein [Planctomycetota bacterium]